MAEWRVYEADTPQCTSCGMWMPFARYRRGQGTNARSITDFCPHCGKKMTAMPMCESCVYGNGEWKDDGICFACREQVWIPGKPHRQVGNEKWTAQKGAKTSVFNSSAARKRRTKPMKTVTYEEFLEFKPCWLEYEDGAERIKAYFDRFGGRMSALDILNLNDVSAEDKLWSVLREEFIPAPILHEFACVCAEYALSLVEEPDPRSIRAIEVKRAWLRGEATDEELAAAWEAARYAYDAARCAYEAARAAVWDTACEAARAAAAAARANAAAARAAAARAAAREAQVAYLIMALEEEK